MILNFGEQACTYSVHTPRMETMRGARKSIEPRAQKFLPVNYKAL